MVNRVLYVILLEAQTQSNGSLPFELAFLVDHGWF